jgi:hypothetical protein
VQVGCLRWDALDKYPRLLAKVRLLIRFYNAIGVPADEARYRGISREAFGGREAP